MGSLADIRRKVRALAALAQNAGATEHERANATVLKAKLERRLKATGEPKADWSDNIFRLGKQLKELNKRVSSAASRQDWTDNAFRLGKTLRRGYKKWL